MHDLALQALLTAHHHLIIAAPSAPSAPSSGGNSDTVTVAIVTTIGLVVATAVTAITTTLKKSPTPPPPEANPNEVITKQYIRSLESDRREFGKLRILYSHLREACLSRGLDPDEMIREQDTP